MPPVYGFREAVCVSRGRLVIESDESKDYNETILLGDSLRARLKTSNLFTLSNIHTLIIYDIMIIMMNSISR